MKKSVIILLLCMATGLLAFNTQWVPDKPITKAKLGELLFSEKILSKDSSVSCASCHIPQFGFADTVAFSKGVRGTLTERNTPSVLNVKERPYFFWDGRAASLEKQALMPIEHPNEMGLPVKEAVRRLNANAKYKALFYKVFKQLPNAKNIGAAFAAFERTLETTDSRYDDWSDRTLKLTTSEERGRRLFISKKAKCFDCHFTPDFTGDEFRNIGLYNGAELNDAGRYTITGNKEDMGKFKTPGLRNVAVTAPYMHNGMFKTLEEVIDYYDNPQQVIKGSINIDTLLQQPLGLTPQDKKDLLAFLHTLTDRRFLVAAKQ